MKQGCSDESLVTRKWWSALKSTVSDSSSSLPPLVGGGGSGLVCESVGKTDLLSSHFDNKQSWSPVDLPSTCLTTFAFRSRKVHWEYLTFSEENS